MKKFISMVMAAAMVVSVVPATAFAADAKATAKVVDSKNLTEAEAATVEKGYVKNDNNTPDDPSDDTLTEGIKDAGARPEVQIKITSADFTAAELAAGVSTEITLTLDNAEWINGKNTNVSVFRNAVTITDDDASKVNVAGATTGIEAPTAANLSIKDIDDDEVTLVFDQAGKAFEKDDKIAIKLDTVVLTKTSAGTKATVAVDSDDLDLATDDMVFVEVKDSGLTASIKKVAEVAEEELTYLEKDLKIKTDVSKFQVGQVLELKLSGGFKFNTIATNGTGWTVADSDNHRNNGTATEYKDETKAYIRITTANLDEITIKANELRIDADTAKEGAEGKLTVKAVRENNVGFSETADAVVVAKVVAQDVTVKVDEDEDVPVIYSGVNVNNVGITDDSDHVSLKVTIEEPVADSLDTKKALTMTLPEGVYATDVNVTDVDDWFTSKGVAEAAFATAYKKGEYDNFEFVKRTFDETDPTQDEKGKLEFELTLVAEPDFAGDVTLTVEGGGLDKAQKVTIAKFVAPYTVEAAQNDLIIDYRNTKVPTNIVVKEAEAGLWDEGLEFTFDIDKFGNGRFENDATYKVDDKSEMEVKTIKNELGFKVDERSGDDAAAVTISDVSLYMDRSLPAGAYDLELLTNAAQFMYVESLFTTENTDVTSVPSVAIGRETLAVPTASQAGGTYAVADAVDYVDGHDLDVDNVTVKEGYINIITAGRDQDDASFTKKVVVPVGEKYLIAGEEQVVLDVPAYISAAGYTMLPVRAVATALGINNNNVLWNQASRTVTILYGQRIITMVAGQKVVTVNGNTIPASATVQIKDGRTFLPMRDLATALGVTDITWDAATKTATMNGNQNK